MEYEVLYYNGWHTPPVYYWVGAVRGRTPEIALLKNADKIAKRLKEEFGFEIGWKSEDKIKQEIYLIRENGLVSFHDAKRAQELEIPKRSGRKK